MPVMIAPSVLSADFSDLAGAVKMINSSEADFFHLDIMDGVFVPNISFGFPVVESISKIAEKPLDAHLMIVNPEKYIKRFGEAGVSWLSIHYEATVRLHRALQEIKSYGMKAGIAFNPHTPVSALEDIVQEADFILLMSVNPGFSGQSFIDNSLSKISRLKDLLLKKSPSCLIEVDGGVNKDNAAALVHAGADILVAGNSVFGTNDPVNAVKTLKSVR